MKGIELPISTLVIVVIVIVVLLAVIALFFGVWNPGRSSISLEAAKNNACQMLISTGCNDPDKIIVRDFDVDGDNIINEAADDNLLKLCEKYYGISGSEECKTQICHCE
jgi:hypothetical protein